MAEPIEPRRAPEPASVAESASVVEPVETLVVELPAPKRKRRRWIGWLVLVIVLVVLTVAFFVADAIAKQVATAYVRDRIVEVLALDSPDGVTVDLGSGSTLLQLATGSLDAVHVDVDAVTLGEITGDAQITATDVPLDSAKPLGTLGIVVTVDESNVQKLSSFMSGLDLTTIELKDNLIRIGTEFDAVLVKIPVAVDLKPSAKDGGINFDPQNILLGEQQISVADLRANSLFQGLAGDLLASRDFCVATYLPKALTIDAVDVVGKNLVVSINGDGTALGGPGLSTMGTCP